MKSKSDFWIFHQSVFKLRQLIRQHRKNMDKDDVLYFRSEMGKGPLRRLRRYDQPAWPDILQRFQKTGSNFHHKHYDVPHSLGFNVHCFTKAQSTYTKRKQEKQYLQNSTYRKESNIFPHPLAF